MSEIPLHEPLGCDETGKTDVCTETDEKVESLTREDISL
jgi:hypothetical protein